MYFILGLTTGLLISAIIFVLMVYFRPEITEAVERIEAEITERRSPETGDIFVPKTEEEEAREEIIAQNRARGIDTPISQLSPKDDE